MSPEATIDLLTIGQNEDHLLPDWVAVESETAGKRVLL